MRKPSSGSLVALLLVVTALLAVGTLMVVRFLRPSAERPGARPSFPPLQVGKDEFAAAEGGADAPADGKVQLVAPAAPLGEGRLERALRIAVPTRGSMAPGLVANGGLMTGEGSLYRDRYGLQVEFVLLEDRLARLEAFYRGEVDLLWETADSLASQLPALEAGGVQGRVILLQGFSRGADALVARPVVESVDGLPGRKVAAALHSPSHFFLLYLLAHSGLTPEQRGLVQASLFSTNDAVQAADGFASGRMDAALSWEPFVTRALEERGEGRVVVSTTAAPRLIADVLVARAQVVEEAPATLRDFVAGWFDGLAVMTEDPVGSEAVLSRALALQPGQASRMVAGLALGGWADNAQGLGLTPARGEVATLLEVAQQVWRKQGSLSRTVDVKPWVDGRFVAAVADRFAGRALVESEPFRSRTRLAQRSLYQRPVALHFEQGTDSLLPGATRLLDALGSALGSFPEAALQVEGWQGGGQPSPSPRARQVARYLQKRWGVEASRLLPAAGGADGGAGEAGTAAGGGEDVLQVVLVGR